MELDDLAAALYSAPPGEFVAARDEYVRQAKEAGDRDLVAALKSLRRPTQTAWLVNLLWHRRRELVEQLLSVGAEFRGSALTRQRMQELTGTRRAVLQRLLREARSLAQEAGVTVTADRAMEIENTLGAAMADQDAAEQLRGGRLTTPLSYSGFGPELHLVRAAELVPDLVPSDADSADDSDSADADAGPQDAASRRARAAAQAAVRAAEGAIDVGTRDRDRAVERRAEIARRQVKLNTELARVQRQLAELDDQLADADEEVDRHSERLDEAHRRLQDARAQEKSLRTQ